jgi:hypothetical protein
MEIRSYRSVFDLERRIYSVDRLRLNPSGVPVRGVGYFLVLLLVALIASHLPLFGALARVLPWYLRELALPCAGALLLGSLRLEGRTFHRAAAAMLRHRTGPRLLAGAYRPTTIGRVWSPPELLLLPDGSDPLLRRLRYTGPGAVLVAVKHERTGGVIERGVHRFARARRRPALHIRAHAMSTPRERGEVIALAAGATLVVEAQAGRAR